MLKYTLYTQNVNDAMKLKNYPLHFAVSINKQTFCKDNVVHIYNNNNFPSFLKGT